MSESEPPTRVSIAAGPLVGPVLRRVVGMFAARADLPLDRLDDAVLVADVVVRPRGDALEVIVSDEGRGIGPSPDTAGPGLGMPLIAALADTFEVQRDRGNGSRLVMRFLRSRSTPAMGMA